MSEAAEQKRMYVAQCVNDLTLFWNNDSGWGEVQTAQVYDDLASSTLPFEGQWVALASVDQLCTDVALSTSKCALLMCGQEGEQEIVAQFYRAHKEPGLRAAKLGADKAIEKYARGITGGTNRLRGGINASARDTNAGACGRGGRRTSIERGRGGGAVHCR